MFDALRSLGHSVTAPQRDPAGRPALDRSASGLSRAPSSATAPSTPEAFWEVRCKGGRWVLCVAVGWDRTPAA